MNMKFYRKLPIPQETKEWYPVTPEMAAVKRARDEAIRDIFTGQSDRFLLVIGPCSADKSESVLEYIGRLRRVADRVQDKILIVPPTSRARPATATRACSTSRIRTDIRICCAAS